MDHLWFLIQTYDTFICKYVFYKVERFIFLHPNTCLDGRFWRLLQLVNLDKTITFASQVSELLFTTTERAFFHTCLNLYIFRTAHVLIIYACIINFVTADSFRNSFSNSLRSLENTLLNLSSFLQDSKLRTEKNSIIRLYWIRVVVEDSSNLLLCKTKCNSSKKFEVFD